MQLPAILRPHTAGQIEATQQRLNDAQDNLARLATERQAAVAAADDVAAVLGIDAKIAAERGRIAALGERLVVLNARAMEEDRKSRAERHAEAVETFGGKLSAIADAADEIEKAIRGLVAAVNRYERAAAAAASAWPPGVPQFNAHHLDGGRLGELLKAAFSPGGLWRRRGSDIVPGPSGREYAERASTAATRVAGFAQGERGHHVELMQDLRAAPELVDDGEPAAA